MKAISQAAHGNYTDWVCWGEYKQLKVWNSMCSTHNQVLVESVFSQMSETVLFTQTEQS